MGDLHVVIFINLTWHTMVPKHFDRERTIAGVSDGPVTLDLRHGEEHHMVW